MRYIKAYEFNFNPKEWFKRQKYKPGDYVILFTEDLGKIEENIKKINDLIGSLLNSTIYVLNPSSSQKRINLFINQRDKLEKVLDETRYVRIIKYYKDVGYLVEPYDGEKHWILKKSVARKMTPEEIKEFEFKKTANKYNL